MTKNVGGIDRVLRGVLGAAILAWGIWAQSWWGVIGAVLLFTAVFQFCGLYTLIGINSAKKD